MKRAHTNSPGAGTRPEIELLLCCARTHIDTRTAERIKGLLLEPIDWQYLIRTALRHGVVPLLYRSLNSSFARTVPKTAKEQLRAHFHVNARKSLLFTGELLKLLNLFEAHAIKAVPFKGPVLAEVAYGNCLLRQFSDLDILIHKADFARTKKLLASQGYKPWKQLTESQEDKHLQSEHAYTFVRNDSDVKIDLHWKIAQDHFAIRLDSERLWERLETVSIAGRQVPSFSRQDMLLILCAHGSKHGWERLGWICDVAEMIRSHPRIDWNELMEQSLRMKTQRMLSLGLYMANNLLGAGLPEVVLQKVSSDPELSSLALRVRERLQAEPDNMPDLVDRTAFYIRMRERLRDRIPYLLFSLRRVVTPNSRDREFVHLPGSLSFLHLLLRPVRLLRDYGLRPLKPLLKHFRFRNLIP